MKFNVNEAIERLVEDYQPGTAYRRAILLYQLQTWVYYPSGLMPDYAGAIAAARVLELYGLAQFAGPSGNSARQLKSCLEDPIYRDIYDAFLKPVGGWTILLRAPSPKEFGRIIQDRQANSDVVCDIIDYRFRYLFHGGQKHQEANISHGQFYVWKGDQPTEGKSKTPRSGKTIRTRWSELKTSAAFVYISERHGGKFWPNNIIASTRYRELQLNAKDVEALRRFLGRCAQVMETLGDKKGELKVTIPNNVKRIPPSTEPLSESDIARMKDYSSEYEEMRRS
jgi:hypothetical protein